MKLDSLYLISKNGNALRPTTISNLLFYPLRGLSELIKQKTNKSKQTFPLLKYGSFYNTHILFVGIIPT
jgi:hypothetical protein